MTEGKKGGVGGPKGKGAISKKKRNPIPEDILNESFKSKKNPGIHEKHCPYRLGGIRRRDFVNQAARGKRHSSAVKKTTSGKKIFNGRYYQRAGLKKKSRDVPYSMKEKMKGESGGVKKSGSPESSQQLQRGSKFARLLTGRERHFEL